MRDTEVYKDSWNSQREPLAKRGATVMVRDRKRTDSKLAPEGASHGPTGARAEAVRTHKPTGPTRARAEARCGNSTYEHTSCRPLPEDEHHMFRNS